MLCPLTSSACVQHEEPLLFVMIVSLAIGGAITTLFPRSAGPEDGVLPQAEAGVVQVTAGQAGPAAQGMDAYDDHILMEVLTGPLR